MNTNLDEYFTYGILTSFIIFYVIWLTFYVKYWIQFKQGFRQLGLEWPLLPQRELTDRVMKDIRGVKIIYISTFKLFKILIFPPTKDPIIMKPLKGIRRCWFALILFPIILAFVAIVVLVIAVNP